MYHFSVDSCRMDVQIRRMGDRAAVACKPEAVDFQENSIKIRNPVLANVSSLTTTISGESRSSRPCVACGRPGEEGGTLALCCSIQAARSLSLCELKIR